MNPFINSLLDQSPVTLVVHLAVFAVWFLWLRRVFHTRWLATELASGESTLRDIAAGRQSPDVVREEGQEPLHPGLRTLRSLPNDKAVSNELLKRRSEHEIDSLFGPLLSSCSANRSTAVLVGFLGTILGIFFGARAFSHSHDHGLMLTAISTSLMTTFFGVLASQLEAANLRKLERLHRDTVFNTAELLESIVPVEPAAARTIVIPEPARSQEPLESNGHYEQTPRPV